MLYSESRTCQEGFDKSKVSIPFLPLPPRFAIELMDRVLGASKRFLLDELPGLLTPGGIRSTETREVEVLSDLFRRLRRAETDGDYSPVEGMVHPDAVLRVRGGESIGREAVVNFLREMGKSKYKAQIVAPKGGLTTVLIEDVGLGRARRSSAHEQIYRLLDDALVELIDIGRTPDMVYRSESQPF